MKYGLYVNTRIAKGGTPLFHPLPRVRKHERSHHLIFFYHPDHLGSTSYVTDADGNIAQHIEYIPYGEVFVEERNNSFSTNYLFNALILQWHAVCVSFYSSLKVLTLYFN